METLITSLIKIYKFLTSNFLVNCIYILASSLIFVSTVFEKVLPLREFYQNLGEGVLGFTILVIFPLMWGVGWLQSQVFYFIDNKIEYYELKKDDSTKVCLDCGNLYRWKAHRCPKCCCFEYKYYNR